MNTALDLGAIIALVVAIWRMSSIATRFDRDIADATRAVKSLEARIAIATDSIAKIPLLEQRLENLSTIVRERIAFLEGEVRTLRDKVSLANLAAERASRGSRGSRHDIDETEG